MLTEKLFLIPDKFQPTIRMKPFISLVVCLCLHGVSFGQDSTKASPFQLGGYVKFLETGTFDQVNKTQSNTHLIHNRLRMKWSIGHKLYLQTEVRNRIFWGSSVQQNPFFADYLRNANEWLNLSSPWIRQSDLVAHTTIDRLFFDYKYKQLSMRIGRQRINWGIASIWNPNDLFNAFNFLDVDYEERPGSDALKAQYHLENMSSFDFVYAQTGINSSIYAGKYFFNAKGFDVQIIAGNYKGGGTFGLGLAGNWGDAGLKAEAQHYVEKPGLLLPQTNVTVGIDYMMSKGWYINGGYLYNSLGISEPIGNWNFVDFRLSSKNLMPTKHNYLISVSKQLNPLSSLSLTTIYAPQTNLLIAVPTLTYSAANNIELNMFWQSFFAELNQSFRPMSNVLMGRIRWSY